MVKREKKQTARFCSCRHDRGNTGSRRRQDSQNLQDSSMVGDDIPGILLF